MKNNKNGLYVFIAILVVIIIAVVAVFALKNKDSKTENNNNNVGEENVIQDDNTVNEEFVQKVDDNTKVNISDKFNETKEFKGLSFENTQFTYSNATGQSVLLVDITNNTGKDITEPKVVDVIFYDKIGNELTTLPGGGLIGPVKAGEKVQFNVSATLDYANAYDYKIVIK